MPIYEFACPSCRTIFPFLGKASDRHRRPSCPKCGRPELERVPSVFAIASGSGRAAEERGASGPEEGAEANAAGPTADRPSAAEQRMERELMRLMSQAEHLDESDPRQMGAFLRRMTEVSGMPKDAAMEEAIRRMESGEDPERVEEELGDLFGEGAGDEEEGGGGIGGFHRDDGMYSF